MATAAEQRAEAMNLCNYFIKEGALVDYVEVRFPGDIMSSHGMSLEQIQALFAKGGHIAIDCSEACDLIARLSGWEDPMGLGYSGYGNTVTLLGHLPHIAWDEVHQGTIIVFDGPMSEQHAVMVMQPNPQNPQNPRVFSQGGEVGPYEEDLLTEAQYHLGCTMVPLGISGLLAKPVPSYHYDRYDSVRKRLASDTNSERNVVKNYDDLRRKVGPTDPQMLPILENLFTLADDLEAVMRRENDPHGLHFYRAYRLPRIKARANGAVVEPTV